MAEDQPGRWQELANSIRRFHHWGTRTMKLIKGKTYRWNEILNGLNSVAGPVFYLLHKKGTELITAVCLRIDTDPRAPYEVLVGDGPFIRDWADKLYTQKNVLPVFVEELDGNRYYRGRFRPAGQSIDPNEIQLRGQQAERKDIYKIIFLEEILAQA
jgi:hypothetical protein